MIEELLKPNEVLQGVRDRYMVLNHVASGGMGAVYRAQRLSDSTTWALKKMRVPANITTEELEDNRRLFEQETRLLSALEHVNIPVVADDFEHEGLPVMVMEFIEGQTLEDYLLNDRASLSEQQIIAYGIQLCRVLHYLHTRTPPIIYRDLKPPNIMITSMGVMKLIDFGVARTHKGQKKQDTIAMGSAGYAPPEQYGKAETDARSDIYALGATLLHLATGTPPVPLQPPRAGDIRKFVPAMKPETEKVIIKAMSLRREERFQSCDVMEQALMKCLDVPYKDPTRKEQHPPPVSEKPRQPSPGRQPQRRSPPAHPPAPAPPPAPEPADSVPCHHCGRMNKTGARFCSGCGMPLGGALVACLTVKSPRGTWEMRIDRFPFRIGRRDPRQHHYPELDLAEHDRGVASRYHATIELKDDIYLLTDQGSTNGTMINEVRIPAHVPHPLRTGDRIRVGEVSMEFKWT